MPISRRVSYLLFLVICVWSFKVEATACTATWYTCTSSCSDQISKPSCQTICSQAQWGCSHHFWIAGSGNQIDPSCASNNFTHCTGQGAPAYVQRQCICQGDYCENNGCTTGYTRYTNNVCPPGTRQLGSDACGCLQCAPDEGGGGGDPCEFGCTPGYEPIPPGESCHSEATLDECGCCATFSPIIVNMDGQGIAMSDAARGALFDINGLRHIFMVAWPTTTASAWLARDVNGNGAIDSGAELFGNATRLQRGGIAKHGFQALDEFDVNRDGMVDATDPMYASLLLWFDANRDGQSTPQELVPFSSRFTAIATDARESRKTDRYGNAFRYRAKVFVDGHRDGPTAWFAYDVFPLIQLVSR